MDPLPVGALNSAAVVPHVLQGAGDGSCNSAPGLATSDACGSTRDGHWKFVYATAEVHTVSCEPSVEVRMSTSAPGSCWDLPDPDVDDEAVLNEPLLLAPNPTPKNGLTMMV